MSKWFCFTPEPLTIAPITAFPQLDTRPTRLDSRINENEQS